MKSREFSENAMEISIPQSTFKSLFIIVGLLLFLSFKISLQFVIFSYGNHMVYIIDLSRNSNSYFD